MSSLRAVPDKFEGGYLDRLDGRTALAATMRAQWQEMTDDLGGADRLSYAQRCLVERVLWLEHWLRIQEQALAEGRLDEFDAGRWTQALNTLVGVLSRLGLERREKDVTDLHGYLAQKAGHDG